MVIRCEFCNEEIKDSYCPCDESVSALKHMINMFECLNHCDRMLKAVEDCEDLTEEQAEKIIHMCSEEKKKIKTEMLTLLKEVVDETDKQETNEADVL